MRAALAAIALPDRDARAEIDLGLVARSALQAARLSSFAEGEGMCRRWIEDNRKFDKGERE